jgi:hypothetical protein
VHTTLAGPAAGMSDNALLVEMMTADDVVGEDTSPLATHWQTAAFAAVKVRWVISATEGSARWEVCHHASGAAPILMAQENPTSLSAIMFGEPCRCGLYWRRSDREAWR